MAFTKIAAAGIGSTELVTLHSLEVLNNATVGGVLTYEDVTNVDSVGLITARNGIVVGSGITLSKDGNIFTTGISTFGGNIQMGDDNPEFEMNAGGPRFRVPASNTLTIHTGGGLGSTNEERLRITSDGKVGINQTPTRELSLHSPDNNNALIHFTNDDTGETASDGILIGLNGNEDCIVNNQESGKNIIFYTHDGSSVGERLRIEQAGNVNISKSALVGAAITVGTSSSTSTLIDKGFIELTRSSGDTYIDFKNAFADDYDARIITSGGNQLQFFTGGEGSTLCALQTGTAKVAIATDTSPTLSKLQIHSDKLGGTAGNSQELLYLRSPDVSNITSYRFTNYRHADGTSHTSSEGRLRRHVDSTDMGFFGLGDGYVNFGYGTAEKMRMNSSGILTKPYTPSFSAKGTTDAISAGSPLPFDSTGGINHNNGGHYDTGTYKFTCPVDGYYYVTCHVVPTNFDVGYNVELYVKDNSGNRHFLDRKVKTTNYASNNFSVGGSRVIYKTATSTLWVEFNSIHGSPTLEGSSHFGITLIA